MITNSLRSFKIDDVAMRYSDFAPRLFNYCLSLGMAPNGIIPSRAFCSDENQGYPIILIAKHFGTFPFNHGRVGGIVASDRHGPHASHGKDVVLIQASHVGYDPDTSVFGVYRRMQTKDKDFSTDCGAICGLLHWYQEEYHFACQQISLDTDQASGNNLIIIDNQLLQNGRGKQEREEGIFLNLEKLVKNNEVIHEYSTAKAFIASDTLIEKLNAKGLSWPEKRTCISRDLSSEFFYFKRKTNDVIASGLLDRNLIKSMPEIICSSSPALAAAQVNAQQEFDRTFRTIVKEKTYRGKKVLFISGIHIDISPREDQLFPLTKFVPWAAYIQNEQGEGYTLEQQELSALLKQQSTENPHKIDLTEAIHQMEAEAEIVLQVDQK